MPIIKNKWLRGLIGKYIKVFIHRFMKSPVQAAHQEYSMIYSQHDNPGKPSKLLMDLAISAIVYARQADLSFLKARATWTYPDPNEFPGEHYRLLTGLIAALRPQVIIEIGTERGMSCLAMKSALLPNAKIYTFDIKTYKEMENPILDQADFDDSLAQYIVDLTDRVNQEKFRSLFQDVDFIFMDAAKDGKMERLFLSYFDSINFNKKPILMIDDIYNWNMLAIWREITNPKMDVSSFGHFTGTGIVQLRS